ncbi:AAA family ATPase [uncultured Ruminococcus sp.]|uniref:AAA family ATPase n=1 Tax=uncultured Ruminococcus sp. TaxID=165186 RepID=UPI00258F2EAD|nr:AAA family ATPase [uncultured Ruminococcus sp.]
MKEYDYKAIPYKERLTTLCGIALNQYNVIHIDIQQFVSKYPVIKDMVARLTKELLFDVKMEMPDVTLFDETDLVRTLKDIFSQKREKFIFIIDEWDSIFRVHRDNATAPKEYLDFLRDLLKGQPYVALAYMTGILPIKKYGQHSALNMFKEYAMTINMHSQNSLVLQRGKFVSSVNVIICLLNKRKIGTMAILSMVYPFIIQDL